MIWKPGLRMVQIVGSERRANRVENLQQWLREGKNKWWGLDRTRMRWWQMEKLVTDVEKSQEQMEADRNRSSSIYCAQAKEIEQCSQDEQLVFQFTGLHNWRDVAYKTLRSVGWEPTCAYEDTIFPCREGKEGIKWDMLTFVEETETTKKVNDKGMDVYVYECYQQEGLVMAVTLVMSQGHWVWADIHVLGRAVTGKSSTVSGIALAVGLESLGGLLGVEDTGGGNPGVPVRIFTDYESLHDKTHRRR